MDEANDLLTIPLQVEQAHNWNETVELLLGTALLILSLGLHLAASLVVRISKSGSLPSSRHVSIGC